MIEGFSSTVAKDFFELITGDKIGSGISREVYECRLDASIIIKFEEGAKSFQNIQEWEQWQSWKDVPNVAKWLAPCVDISACGSVLIQKRTKPAKKYPDLLPSFLTDTKRGNFGLFENRLVCHDYANIITTVKERLTKVNWW